MSYSSLTETEIQAIKALYVKIKDKFNVSKVVLFGSKARNEAEKYSDVDLIVLTRDKKTKQDRWLLSDIASDINIDYGVALACLYFNESDWESGEDINPLLKHDVERDGITLIIQ